MAKFVVIDDDLPDVTIATLRAAAEHRKLDFHRIFARDFAYDRDVGLAAGDMLYRAATSFAAVRVEQFLYQPWVATFYQEPDGVFFPHANYQELLQRSAIPIPRTIPIGSTHRPLIDHIVTRLGGYPVVLKILGWSNGIGTMRVDGSATLYSLLDYLIELGSLPLLMSYVDDAIHWRVTVAGSSSIAVYRNEIAANDFRSVASEAIADFAPKAEPVLERLAVRAVHALKLEFGGVDILEHRSGRFYVLEVNFPCFFAHAQVVAQIDVAGGMVDHLLEKSRRILGASRS